MKPSAILIAHGLTFHHPQRELFNNLSLHVMPGVTLVRGGDGCGKSTLLRLMAGDITAQAGALAIRGVPLSEQPLAYQSQAFWMDPRTSSFDQVTALAYFECQRVRYPQWDHSLVPNLCAGLSLTPQLDKPMYMLSTGSKRKVWLAAAFASGAALTLLDEPFAALDKVSIVFVRRLLNSQAITAERALVVADYEAPIDVPLADVIELGE